MSHTEGKLWFIDYRSDGHQQIGIVDKDMVKVAYIIRSDEQPISEKDVENARRITACWNAFKGMPTETVESMERVRGTLDGAIKSVADERDALKAEVERLRKDAERYRWLRENLHRLQSMRPLHAPKPEKLDAAIDAEIKEPT